MHRLIFIYISHADNHRTDVEELHDQLRMLLFDAHRFRYLLAIDQDFITTLHRGIRSETLDDICSSHSLIILNSNADAYDDDQFSFRSSLEERRRADFMYYSNMTTSHGTHTSSYLHFAFDHQMIRAPFHHAAFVLNQEACA